MQICDFCSQSQAFRYNGILKKSICEQCIMQPRFQSVFQKENIFELEHISELINFSRNCVIHQQMPLEFFNLQEEKMMCLLCCNMHTNHTKVNLRIAAKLNELKQVQNNQMTEFQQFSISMIDQAFKQIKTHIFQSIQESKQNLHQLENDKIIPTQFEKQFKQSSITYKQKLEIIEQQFQSNFKKLSNQFNFKSDLQIEMEKKNHEIEKNINILKTKKQCLLKGSKHVNPFKIKRQVRKKKLNQGGDIVQLQKKIQQIQFLGNDILNFQKITEINQIEKPVQKKKEQGFKLVDINKQNQLLKLNSKNSSSQNNYVSKYALKKLPNQKVNFKFIRKSTYHLKHIFNFYDTNQINISQDGLIVSKINKDSWSTCVCNFGITSGYYRYKIKIIKCQEIMNLGIINQEFFNNFQPNLPIVIGEQEKNDGNYKKNYSWGLLNKLQLEQYVINGKNIISDINNINNFKNLQNTVKETDSQKENYFVKENKQQESKIIILQQNIQNNSYNNKQFLTDQNKLDERNDILYQLKISQQLQINQKLKFNEGDIIDIYINADQGSISILRNDKNVIMYRDLSINTYYLAVSLYQKNDSIQIIDQSDQKSNQKIILSKIEEIKLNQNQILQKHFMSAFRDFLQYKLFRSQNPYLSQPYIELLNITQNPKYEQEIEVWLKLFRKKRNSIQKFGKKAHYLFKIFIQKYYSMFLNQNQSVLQLPNYHQFKSKIDSFIEI